MSYIKGFFLIDLVSSIPFDLIGSDLASANKLLRILKIPRLIKIFKIAKIFKLNRIIKGTPISIFIKLNMGMLKTTSVFMATMLILHLGACVWCAIPTIEDDQGKTWIYRSRLENQPEYNQYLSAFYYCFVTLTTIGYGDISPHTKRRQR